MVLRVTDEARLSASGVAISMRSGSSRHARWIPRILRPSTARSPRIAAPSRLWQVRFAYLSFAVHVQRRLFQRPLKKEKPAVR